jgi:hypothetical protein
MTVQAVALRLVNVSQGRLPWWVAALSIAILVVVLAGVRRAWNQPFASARQVGAALVLSVVVSLGIGYYDATAYHVVVRDYFERAALASELTNAIYQEAPTDTVATKCAQVRAMHPDAFMLIYTARTVQLESRAVCEAQSGRHAEATMLFLEAQELIGSPADLPLAAALDAARLGAIDEASGLLVTWARSGNERRFDRLASHAQSPNLHLALERARLRVHGLS